MPPTFVKLPYRSSESEIQSFTPPVRPKFNHQITQDRLREGFGRIPSLPMINNIRKDRKSVFKEVGLVEDSIEGDTAYHEQRHSEREFGKLTGPAPIDTSAHRREPTAEARTGGDSSPLDEKDSPQSPTSATSGKQPWYVKLATARRPKVRSVSSAPPATVSSIQRFTMLALLIAVVLPGFGYINGREKIGADAGVIRKRDDSPTDVCTRWAHQTALLNGTLYMFGGQAKSTSDQTTNTWNNDFLTLDLTKDWGVTSPALKGLPRPDGPPAVSLGYLWNDYNNLFLYGGEYADNPFTEPGPSSTWRYSIGSGDWTEFTNPQTSDGNASDAGGQPVQRAAEGAGLSVPELGQSWYFGGHLDLSTTQGWSNQIARVYLKSLLEFTHPGYTNDGVYMLAAGNGAPESGVYRNITQGGLQTETVFSERADGVLVFVPGWGKSGVLIGFGGGSEPNNFVDDMSTLDVYDIASSVWYHQRTTGTAPGKRVNACAVVASAPDASSFQIYLFGGQNLQPYKEQTQYDDMYILSIPAFTWVGPVKQNSDNKPAARAGHTCNLRDGQIVVVGGYVGTEIPCDSPGIYVFNASSLEWTDSFKALAPKADYSPDNSVLGASYGYIVPEEVVSVIGGGPSGSATVTAPSQSPTGGPFATGKSPVFTVTASGATATVTAPGATNNVGGGGSSTGGGGGGDGDGNGDTSSDSEGVSGGLIAAAVIASLAGVLAGYLGYCAWLYRRQVRAYKTHLAVANRYSTAGASHGSFGPLGALFGRKGSKESRDGEKRSGAKQPLYGYGGSDEKRGGWFGHSHNDSSSTADSFTWVGRDREQLDHLKPWSSDEPTPGGSGTEASSSRPSPYRGSDDRRGTYGFAGAAGAGAGGGGRTRPRRSYSPSGGSTSSTEGLLEGQELSFFSVVMGPRRALRVVNGLEDGEHGEHEQN